MKKEQLAAMLHGRQIGDETTPEIIKAAKENNLLIVYGASDDLCEFEGAFREEADCYDGGEIGFSKKGEVFTDGHGSARSDVFHVEAVWAQDAPDDRECSWHYKTDLPHATFDIMENGELYCVGMVIDLKELA